MRLDPRPLLQIAKRVLEKLAMAGIDPDCLGVRINLQSAKRAWVQIIADSRVPRRERRQVVHARSVERALVEVRLEVAPPCRILASNDSTRATKVALKIPPF